MKIAVMLAQEPVVAEDFSAAKRLQTFDSLPFAWDQCSQSRTHAALSHHSAMRCRHSSGQQIATPIHQGRIAPNHGSQHSQYLCSIRFANVQVCC